MKKPQVADKAPREVELKKDETRYWCACGRSANQPWCDGSHRDTPFTPKAFTVEKSGIYYMCMCKQTKNPPYCDGSHQKL